MKRIVVVILYFNLMTFIGHAQIINISPSKFNIEDFEKKAQNTDTYNFQLQNGNFVQQGGDKKSGYYERVEEKTSPYGYYKEFFPNGELKTGGPTFYGHKIGTHKNYNKDGVLIDSINYNKRFTFTIDNLVKEVDSIYHVNLLDKSLRCDVALSGDNNPIPSSYYISIPLEAKNTRDIIISGINGRVIEDRVTTRYIKENE